MDESSGIIDSQDVSEQELETLKGDAVGNNLYSNRWIISTLMSLCELHKNGWTKELEDRLCMLWDLTCEEEVVSHLMSFDFPKIAKNVLEESEELRLIEIIFGIIGNMCRKDDIIDTIGNDKELVRQILHHLMSDDTLTLIQLLRILQCIAGRITVNPQSTWTTHLTECEFFGESITFMLMNSTNDDLLMAATNILVLLSRMSLSQQNNFFEKLFKIDDLIPALLESFMQLITVKNISYATRELTYIEQWVEMLIFIIELGLLKYENYENDEGFLKLMEIIYRILEPYKESCNLVSIQQQEATIISDIMRVLISFRCYDANIPSNIDHAVATIIFSLKTVLDSDSKREEPNPKVEINALLCYLDQYWLQIIRLCTLEEIINILRPCEREVCEYLANVQSINVHVKSLCDHMSNLSPNNTYVKSYSEVTPEMIAKVKKAIAILKES